MADNLLYEQSSESQITTEPFVSRQIVYVVDQNNGSYNGQIQLDTSSLSNSGKYASYSEAYFEIPLVLTLQNDTTNAIANWNNLTNAFAAGLKAGYWHLLHSFSVEYNNTSVVQLTPFSNMYIHYKMMTSMSREDVEKFGAGLGFYPDTATSFEFSANAPVAGTNNGVPTYLATSTYGQGLANNRNYGIYNISSVAGQIPGGISLGEVVIGSNGDGAAINIQVPAGGVAGDRVSLAGAVVTGIPIETRTTVNGVATPIDVTLVGQVTLASGWSGDRANLGLYRRQQSTAYTPATTNFQGLLTSGNADTIGKNYYYKGGAYDAWFILAKIRLKDISDFFDKLPLVKGAYLRFIINTNTPTHTISYIRNAGNCSVNSSSNVIVGGTSPVMFASGAGGQGANNLYTTVSALADGQHRNLTLSLSIARNTTLNVPHPTLQQCRLYVPLYQMNPTMEEQYLSLNRTKKIVYRDIYQYQTDVGPGASFNVLLTNGIPNPKFVVVIPMISQGNSTTLATLTQGNITGGVPVAGNNPPVACVTAPVYQSPFTSEPATTSPLVALTNFNIQIAGQNMFIQNELYDFEQFTNELQSVNAINGGLVTGLTSGLISETDFQYMYRYYICDVSRRLPAEDRVPKSVQIIGQSLSAQPVTLFTFIEMEKEIEIDLKIRVCLAKSKASRYYVKRQHVQIAGNPSRCMILTFEGNFERAVVNHYRYSKKSYIIGQSASKHLSPLW